MDTSLLRKGAKSPGKTTKKSMEITPLLWNPNEHVYCFTLVTNDTLVTTDTLDVLNDIFFCLLAEVL